MNTSGYPQFLSHRPCGQDIYGGKSQDRLTKAIAEYIKHVDENDEQNSAHVPRIIGLEGSWGCGKSNVIAQLGVQLKNEPPPKFQYHVLVYDAWAYQEDLQRHTLLEWLVNASIVAKIVSEGERMDDALETFGEMKKSFGDQKSEIYAQIDTLAKLFAWIVVLCSICTVVVTAADKNTVAAGGINIILSFMGVLICLLLLCFVYDKRYTFRLVACLFYNKLIRKFLKKGGRERQPEGARQQNHQGVLSQTIVSKEKSVFQFRDWMQKFSEYIGKEKDTNEESGGPKKVIIVFDNMDRLISEKVKDMWSLIHTFFSDDGFENIWAIVPYDQDRLSQAYFEWHRLDDRKTGETEITWSTTCSECQKTAPWKEPIQHFIDKTFPINFRVAAPVLSDARLAFDKKFKEAFGGSEEEFSAIKAEGRRIGRLYGNRRPAATMRDIISYINDLVALKRIWGDTISLFSLGIFVLFKKRILLNPVYEILSGDYLQQEPYILNDEKLQNDIAALVYNVEHNLAFQILLRKKLEEAVNRNDKHAFDMCKMHSKFYDVLAVIIQNLNADQVNNVILTLSEAKLDRDCMGEIWHYCSKLMEKNGVVMWSFTVQCDILIQNLSEADVKVFVGQYLNGEYVKLKGKAYFEVMWDMYNSIVRRAGHPIDLRWSGNPHDVEEFIEYIDAAAVKYAMFPAECSVRALVSYYRQHEATMEPSLCMVHYVWKVKDDQDDECKALIEEWLNRLQCPKVSLQSLGVDSFYYSKEDGIRD